MITLDVDEIKGSYKNFAEPKKEESSEESAEEPSE